MDDAKQQVLERIKQAQNILVTVSANPSVDALSAALSFTLIINKIGKRATAVVSGALPPAISFLEPAKTFENNVNSLRDFIIALDKNKADHLRYKVEDDVVRIFITPYRTTITEKDLQFSQGDFNVDLILALGVEKRSDLDRAITAHGRILHDATVITINTGGQKSSLGSIDWQDPTVSSLCEMLTNIAEDLQQGVLDQQISTALLTGIVAATDRFSNQLTSPRVMTIAAQLMASGANQQLIATKLRPVNEPAMPEPPRPIPVEEPAAKQVDAGDVASGAAGEMRIDHSGKQRPRPAKRKTAYGPPRPEAALAAAEEALAEALPLTPPAAQQAEDLKQAITEETAAMNAPEQPLAPVKDNQRNNTGGNSKPPKPEPPKPDNPGPDTDLPPIITKPLPDLPPQPGSEPIIGPAHDDSNGSSSWRDRGLQRPIEPPTFGGTLNATAEQALEDKRLHDKEDRNLAILSHDIEPPSSAPQASPLPPIESPVAPSTAPEPSLPPTEPAMPPTVPSPAPVAETLADLEQSIAARQTPSTETPLQVNLPTQPAPANPVSEDAARQAVHAALGVAPPSPVIGGPSQLSALPTEFEPLPPPPATPEPAAVVPEPNATTLAMPPAAESTPSTLLPAPPPLPPMPDFNTLPPAPITNELPAPPPELIPPEQSVAVPAAAPQPAPAPSPGQFRIPGQ